MIAPATRKATHQWPNLVKLIAAATLCAGLLAAVGYFAQSGATAVTAAAKPRWFGFWEGNTTAQTGATTVRADEAAKPRWFGFWEGNSTWFGFREDAPPSPTPPPSPPPFDPDAPVTFVDALRTHDGWKAKNLQLDGDCKTNWMLNSAASTTAVLVRDAMNYIKMPMHLCVGP